MLDSNLLTVRKTFTLCSIKNFLLFKNIKLQRKKNEYEYVYKKDDELKGDNITDQNEGIVEYGNNFIICKIITG